MNKDNSIIHELKACSLWFKEHGRNTNTSVVEICDKAAKYIKELESKTNKGEINMHETTLYCPGENIGEETKLPTKEDVKPSAKRTDQAMSAAHALLTIHNICKENRHTGCEHCILANEDGCCSIMGKFPLEWKFEIKVW